MTVPSYPQNPYPQNPYPGQAAPAAKPSPPGTVTGALIIYVVAAAAAVVGGLLVLNSNVWNDIAANANGTAISVGTLKGVAIGTVIVIAALYLFFAFMMWGGRNWARIVLTVLSALNIASALQSRSVSANGQTYTTGNAGISFGGAALAVVAIVLMFVGRSNPYFRASKAFRKGTQY